MYVSVKRDGDARGQVSLTRAWLERSGDLPLSLSVYGPGPLPGSITSQFLDILASTSSRWRVLKLNMPLLSMSRLLNGTNTTADLSYEMTTLESLELSFTADFSFQSPIIISPSATHLHSIRIRTGSYMEPRRLQFPWSQLRSYVSSSPLDISDCFEIMSACSDQIRQLSLRTKWGSVADAPLVPFLFPELRSLNFCPSGEADFLFDSILSPNLRELSIDLYAYGGTPDAAHEWPKAALFSLFQRSKCPLEKLILHGKTIPPEDLMECVSCLPTLVDIVITYQGRSIVPDFITSLLVDRVASLVAGTESRNS